jgi:surfeit locus 1 family protein
VSWRFARRPSWVIRHVLVVVLVAVMVALGMWQLRRLDERKDEIALLRARQEVPVADVGEVVPAGLAPDAPEIVGVEFRSVSATGVYERDDTVVVVNRSLSGTPGAWVLTPLRLDGGTRVAVNRGFVGFSASGEIEAPAPPEGRVTVQGLVRTSEERGRFGPSDPGDGRLGQLARADIGRLDAQVPYDLLPAYVQLARSTPPEPAADPSATSGPPPLIALGPPELDEGPHLSYAIQWFIFAAIALVGYPILLRKVAADEQREATFAALDRPPDHPDEVDRELEDLLRSEQ